MNSPTVLGNAGKSQSSNALATTATQVVATRATGTSIILTEDQRIATEEALQALDFPTMQSGDIVQLGFQAEKALHGTLDGFLGRLDRNNASKVFALFDRLEKGVNDANLPEVLQKINAGTKPGLLDRLKGLIRGKNAKDVAREAYDEVRDLIAGRTKTLADQMSGLERELQLEMQRLLMELMTLDKLKNAYRDHLGNFAVAAALSQAFLEKARAYVAEEEAKVAQAPDALAQARLQELQSKLQLLESRALALEGTYTRLPADQLVVQQIEQAGVATLQETATTAGARFGSIKMTLLAVNGAFAVKGVQQMSDRQKKLDAQLTQARGVVMKDIVTTASTAPGDNRLAQAEQIEKIIRDTQEIHQLVVAGRRINEEKFGQAREKFQAARNELANLSS